MAGATVGLRGFRETRQAFRRLDKETQKVVKREIRKRTGATKREAKAAVRVRTGLLRRTVRRRGLKGGLIGIVYADAYYGKFVELGTKKTKEYPFLLPAFRKNSSGFGLAVQRLLLKQAVPRARSSGG
jgi:HK97 gp10 family phage protein